MKGARTGSVGATALLVVAAIAFAYPFLWMLLASGKSIAQVAQQVGYESEASFTRAFKRELGMPPAAWRRERGNHARPPVASYTPQAARR